MVFDDLDAPDQAGHIAQRVIDALAEPLQLADRQVSIGASVGIALTDRPDVDPHLLVSHADIAMYEAKRAGKACSRVFEPAMHAQAVDRMNLEQELRAGIRLGQLIVEYQPVFDLDGDEICCFEALVRWDHPTRGRIPPNLFIPLAEEAGLIGELGRTVLGTACADAAEWRRRTRGRPPTVSVNVSRFQLEDPNFMDLVTDTLRDCGLEPTALVLEVTESVLGRDAGRVLAALELARRAGIVVAIDDFGTGYSSLASLAELPVDILKIDKSFIDNIARDAGGRGLVVAIMQLAQTLGLMTVAEGVEYPEQRVALEELGCHHIQGFLLARPMPIGEALDLLSATSTSGSLSRVW